MEKIEIPGAKFVWNNGEMFVEIIDEEKFSIWQWAYSKTIERKN